MAEPDKSDQTNADLQLLPSPDPLTRLLMEADGVTERDLHTLLRRVAKARDPSRQRRIHPVSPMHDLLTITRKDPLR